MKASRMSGSNLSSSAAGTASALTSTISGGGASSIVEGKLYNLPTLIEYDNMRFLVMDAPNDQNLPLYMKELQRHGVTDIVRVCQPTYSKVTVAEQGITVHDWPFEDGEPPNAQIVHDWLALVDERFAAKCAQQPLSAGAATTAATAAANGDNPGKSKKDKLAPASAPVSSSTTSPPPLRCIATHCVAGLGRAPVLVAIALIEHGMAPLDSVAFIRERRRGAINNRQLKFLEQYKRRRKSAKCVIM